MLLYSSSSPEIIKQISRTCCHKPDPCTDPLCGDVLEERLVHAYNAGRVDPFELKSMEGTELTQLFFEKPCSITIWENVLAMAISVLALEDLSIWENL